MDSASDSGSEGWGFESLLACHENRLKVTRLWVFFCVFRTFFGKFQIQPEYGEMFSEQISEQTEKFFQVVPCLAGAPVRISSIFLEVFLRSSSF